MPDAFHLPNESYFFDRFRQRPVSLRTYLMAAVLIVTLFLFAVYVVSWRAPRSFPAGMLIAIREGMTISDASALLKERNVIRSVFWFKAWSKLLGGDNGLKAGEYYLSGPLSVFELVRRLTHGIQDIVPVRVTIPEGLNNREVAHIFDRKLDRFDAGKFILLAERKEGRLFPDTYSIQTSQTEEQIIAQMEENFEKRIATLQTGLDTFGKPLSDVLTMASLVEGEARTTDTRRRVADILWKRLELGMPLQVDAVFPYILGKNTFEVTTEDLNTDSKYNTYLYAGLPPGPINNPSLDAIRATITPIETKYLYYLTDTGGTMRYAVTHAEHLKNRAKYLGK